VGLNMKSTFLNQYRDNINKIASMHGVRSIRVFGSFARGDENASSDIDLLVELDPKRSLLDIIALKYDIQDLTGRKVDVVTTKGVSPYLAEQILKEAVSL
jgi:uncharacterized protein